MHGQSTSISDMESSIQLLMRSQLPLHLCHPHLHHLHQVLHQALHQVLHQVLCPHHLHQCHHLHQAMAIVAGVVAASTAMDVRVNPVGVPSQNSTVREIVEGIGVPHQRWAQFNATGNCEARWTMQ